MNSLGFTNIYTRIMGMTIGKDNQFANPNTVDEPVVPSPIASNNNHNNSGRRTKLHPEVPNSPNGRTPVLNFVIEDEDDEEDDRFFGKNGPTRKSQEAKGYLNYLYLYDLFIYTFIFTFIYSFT